MEALSNSEIKALLNSEIKRSMRFRRTFIEEATDRLLDSYCIDQQVSQTNEIYRSLQELDRMCVKEESRPKYQMLMMIQTDLCNTSLRNREPHLTCTNTQEIRTKQEAENQ